MAELILAQEIMSCERFAVAAEFADAEKCVESEEDAIAGALLLTTMPIRPVNYNQRPIRANTEFKI